MTLAEKIEMVLKIKGLTIARAERLMGVSVATLTKTIKRNSGWHPSTEEKFIKLFNVNPNWWQTGVGDVLDKVSPAEEFDKHDIALITAHKYIERLEGDIRELKEELAQYKKGKSKT